MESFEVRFNKENQKIHKSMEKMLLGLKSNEEKKLIEKLYQNDIDFSNFYLHRKMFLEFVKIRNFNAVSCLDDVIEFFGANIETSSLCPIYYVRLLLAVPGPSSTNERSFSMLKRVKSYLRSTMTQERLNDMAILNTYKKRAAQLKIEGLMDNFIIKNHLRKTTFALANN